jgi:hypothetical protein
MTMKKSIRKIQKHKKKHKKTMKQKHSHHKSRRYSRKYKGGNGDELPMPNPKRARYNPPNPPTPDEEEKRHIQTFTNMVTDIKKNGPMISAISAPETVYALMVKILNLWNYVIQNIRIPKNIDTTRNIIDNLYNDVVIAVPQEHLGDDDEAQSEIINYKSSEILGELFHNVSNITNKTINQVIKIPSIDIFTAPDSDNPDIVQFIQENNHMDEE